MRAASSANCYGKKNALDSIRQPQQLRCAQILLRGSTCASAGRRSRTGIRRIPASRNVRVAGSLFLVYRGRCCNRTRRDRQPATAAARPAIRDRGDSGRHVSGKARGGSLMTHDAHQKVKASHLKRSAYLYVRQSTLRQVLENTESTQRQYALRQRAVALGWPTDKVIVIDSDLGQSGASAADREGFQKLVTEVSMQRAGIVLGLEVSRLARNSSDWHRLLEICALTDPRILGEDGICDPSHFNDRLLLGLKGTMSEAELHVMRARLRGGLLNKARRGELRMPLPMGLVYDEQGQVVLDP